MKRNSSFQRAVLQFVIAVLVSSALFFSPDYQLQAEDLKIHCGAPGYKGLVDLKKCGFGAIRRFDFEPQYYPADTLGIDLFPWLGGWYKSKWLVWLTGHSFQFEADNHDWRGAGMPDHPFFDNNGCVGEATYVGEETPNGWARYAYEGGQGVDNSNWVVRSLRNDTTGVSDPWRFSLWFQLRIEHDEEPDSTYYRTNYHAVFWIKVDADADSAELQLYVEAIKSACSNDRSVLAAETLHVSDLTPGVYDSVHVPFHKYFNPDRYDGCENYDTTLTLTDLAVWWNGKDQVWVDRIDVYDEWAWNSLTGVYDDSATAFIKRHNDKNVKGFTLRDEPRPPQIWKTGCPPDRSTDS